MQVRGADETEAELVKVEVQTEDDEPMYDINQVWYLEYKDDGLEAPDPFAESAEMVKGLGNVSANRKRSITRLEKRLEGRDGVGSKRLEDNVVTGYNAFNVVAPPYNMKNLSKLYDRNAIHKAAVDAKVANIVSLGYDFIESPTAKRKLDSLDNADAVDKFRKKMSRAHDILMEMLDEMNKEDTFTGILQKVWKDYETMGNGYIEIGRSVTTGEISYIGHIPADTIRVRRDRDGFVQIIANKAVFFRNFGEKDPNPITNDTNPNEIIHIWKYSPTSTYYGVPDIVSASGAVAGYDFSERFNLDYFEHKAVPRHVIKLYGATLNPRLAKNILEFFETGLRGKNHRTLFVPLPGSKKGGEEVKLEIEPVEAGIQDSSFNNYRKDAKEEILIAHRVPISKVSLPVGVNLAAARDADKNFKEQVCQPEQGDLQKKLNRIVKEWTDLFILKLNEMTLTDENTQSQIDERRIKTGTETPNEQRARRGQPSHPDGDKLLDLNAAGEAAKQRAEQSTTRQRDAARSASATDSVGEGRNAKGEGRTNGTG